MTPTHLGTFGNRRRMTLWIGASAIALTGSIAGAGEGEPFEGCGTLVVSDLGIVCTGIQTADAGFLVIGTFDVDAPAAPHPLQGFATGDTVCVSGTFSEDCSGTCAGVAGLPGEDGCLFFVGLEEGTPLRPAVDVNGDGAVDVSDLLDVLAAWGPCGSCPEDVDGNGMVGGSDLLQVLAEWTG